MNTELTPPLNVFLRRTYHLVCHQRALFFYPETNETYLAIPIYYQDRITYHYHTPKIYFLKIKETMSAKRIIIIDNDSRVLDIMQEVLGYEGFYVEIFEGTTDVIHLVRQCQPDLVILDYILEGVNGGEICQTIKKQKEIAHIPVMICSAYPRVLQSLGFYGCDAFLAKPFDLEELLNKVNKLLRPEMSVVVSK